LESESVNLFSGAPRDRGDSSTLVGDDHIGAVTSEPRGTRRLFRSFGDILQTPIFLGKAGGRRYARDLRGRPLLDDRAFSEAYYGGSGIPENIPVRSRKVYAEQLGRLGLRVRPEDRATDFYPDLDLADLLSDVGDEFGIKILDEAMREVDGSFDAAVRYLASHPSIRERGPEVPHPGGEMA
jgi:hypothetical protein